MNAYILLSEDEFQYITEILTVIIENNFSLNISDKIPEDLIKNLYKRWDAFHNGDGQSNSETDEAENIVIDKINFL
jgi:hypothetical protein